MNPDGCLPCFCMNVTDDCDSSNWNLTVVSYCMNQTVKLKLQMKKIGY